MVIVFYLLFAAAVAYIGYKGYKLVTDKPEIKKPTRKGGSSGGSREVQETPRKEDLKEML